MVSKTDPGKRWILNYNWKLWIAKQILHNLGRLSTTDKVKAPKWKINQWLTYDLAQETKKAIPAEKKGKYCILPSAASE